MTRRLLLCFAGMAGLAQAQLRRRRLRDQFLGAWRLVSYESIGPGGAKAYPMGIDAVGRLTYDGYGRMSVQVMRRERPRFAAGNRLKGTPEEIKAAFEGFLGYYGAYAIDEKEKFVVHRVECCSFPNWVGTEQKRFFEFSEGQLILRAKIDEVESRLVWARAI